MDGRTIASIAGGIGIGAMLLYIFGVGLGPPTPTGALASAMADLGYTPVALPANVPMPGAILAFEPEDPTKVFRVCAAEEVLGSFRPAPADAAAVANAKELSGSFILDAVGMGSLAAKTQAVHATRATLRLESPKVLSLADTDVVKHRVAVSHDCQVAAQARRDAGMTLTLVRDVIVADVAFDLRFAGSTSVAERTEALEEVAAGIGATVDGAQTFVIVGKAMVVGMKDDKGLATLALNSRPATGGAGERALSLATTVVETPPVATTTPVRVQRP